MEVATSGGHLLGQTTDSVGRRGPRRDSEAMDEQSVEVRGLAEVGDYSPPATRRVLFNGVALP